MEYKMKYILNICVSAFIVLILVVICSVFPSYSVSKSFELHENLTAEEKLWLNKNQNSTIYIGFEPSGGMDYFEDENGQQGYLSKVFEIFSEELGINFTLRPDLNWGEAVRALENDEIQILFGANPTPERLKIMSFTNEIYSVPYTVISHINSTVNTIGDINNKTIAFIESDIVKELFSSAYANLSYTSLDFFNKEDALIALSNNEIDAFIVSGGDVIYDYLFRYPNLKTIVNLEKIRSLMTIASMKKNETLIQILTKSIEFNEEEISQALDNARISYILKILSLTPEESTWINEHPVIKVGVPDDYLPLDYYKNGKYMGIAGHYLNSFANLVGLKIEAIPSSFDEAYTKMINGEIDLLNMAKTDERRNAFKFTSAFSTDRDYIYGKKDSPYVNDIYGLDGKRVAVIEGFWHAEYLNFNLQSPELVIVKDLEKAIDAVISGKADYFIEMPIVAEYYLNGLGYNNIIKKGETSSDSFLYFGIQNSDAPLASIFNKTMVLLNFEESKYLGVQGLPEIENVANQKLISVLFLICLIVLALILILLKIQRDLILTREKERMVYIDPLTGLKNRYYYNTMAKTVDTLVFPQILMVLDINYLKIINDQFGHQIGDELILAVSNVLVGELKKYNGTTIRMGGDEFVLFLTGHSHTEAESLSNNLELLFKSTPLYNGEFLILNALEVACGYACRDSANMTLDELFVKADINMYSKKNSMKTTFMDKII